MSADLTPIDGPLPVGVVAIPGGAALSLTAFAHAVVGDVLDALLDSEDTTLWDRLTELAEGPVATDGRLPYEELQAALADRASSQVPLYGPAALELTRRLREAVAPKAVPAQQDRRAS